MQLKKTRRKRTKNNYFTKLHEDAIVKYANSTCRKEKTKLYGSLIQPAFDEMVNKIIFTYKFNTLPNIDPLRDDCKVWLTTILDKYDPNKGSKAFSYNKKAVYLYLRELTGLNTKQVVNNLNKLREKYRVFKNKWDRQ